MRCVRRILTGLAALVVAVLALAHDPGLSTAQGVVRAATIEITLGFAPVDAEQLLPPEVRVSGKWTQAEFVGAQPLLTGLAPEVLELRADGAVVKPSSARVELAAGDALNFLLVFPRPPRGVLTLRSPKLELLPPGHREFLILTDERGRSVAKKLLSAKDDTVQLDLAAAPPAPAGGAGAENPPRDVGALGASEAVVSSDAPTFWGFLVLGMEHIWTGYDHLLFLFALLLVCRNFRSTVGIITCFTVAHSLTLALATLEVVNLPSRLVEAVIAASIVYVGVENLVRRGEEPKGRWALTFAFGLIHGFGFASVLKQLGVGEGGSGLLLPLFTFNLGVELGQIVVALMVLPVVGRLRENEKFLQRGVPALSAVVALAGLYWLVERTILG